METKDQRIDSQQVPETWRSRLEQMVKEWRGKARSVDTFHATMAVGWKACADDIERFLASLPEGEETGWREIESAPKDGTQILLWAADWEAPAVGRWFYTQSDQRGWWVVNAMRRYPTHFQLIALPSPPHRTMRDPQ